MSLHKQPACGPDGLTFDLPTSPAGSDAITLLRRGANLATNTYTSLLLSDTWDVALGVDMGLATAGRKQVDAIQYLRAVAALAVVTGHCFGRVAEVCRTSGCHFARLNVPTGAGVDLFFLISGFIMVVSSTNLFGRERGSLEFLMRRFVRVIPLYWAVTALIIVLSAIFGKHSAPTPSSIISSILFFPFDTQGRNDGFAFPIVDLGWTLNYEMMFYFVFAAFIAKGRDWCVALVTISLVALVVAGSVWSTLPLPLRFWTRPITLEFVAGMWIALGYQRGTTLSAFVRFAMFSLAVMLLTFPPFKLLGSTTPNSFARVVTWGVPAALVLVVAVSGPLSIRGRAEGFLKELGNSSYSLYLFHPFALILLEKFAARSALLSSEPAIMVAIALCFSIVLAIVVHHMVEKPVTGFLTERLKRSALRLGANPLVDAKEGAA